MHLEVVVFEAELARVRAHVAHGGHGRFLHHVAELAGDREMAVARHGRRLDEEDVAAHRRPGQARGDARVAGAPLDLGGHPRPPQQVVHALHVDGEALAAPVGGLDHLARELAADGADLALQVTHAGFARVARDDLDDRLVAEGHLLRLEAVGLDLPRHQIVPGDVELLLDRVPGEEDDLHAVAQRRRDGLELVGRGDEQHLAEVERQVHVVVAEGDVLFRVEHLEQGARRVAAPIGAGLVDLVDHEQRVVGAGVAHGADDDAGHRPHVRAAMPADLGLVAHAADTDALELAAHGLGDAVAQARLADAGRADEAEDRPVQVGLELAHREELEDAVLDLLEVVVVAVEDPAGVGHVEIVVAAHVPRQRDDPVQVGADHGVLGALRRDVGEPVELPAGGLVGLFRELEIVDLLAQLGDLGFLLVALAELLLDGAHLLAQEVLTLPLVDLAAHVALDLGAQLEHVELAREDADQHAHALLDVALLEQGLLIRGLDAHRAGDEEGERPGVVDVGGRHLELFGQVGHQRDDLAEHAQQAGAQGVDLFALVDDVLDLGDLGRQIRLLLHVLVDVHALQPLDEDAHGAVGQLDHLVGQTHRADGVQKLGARHLDLGVLAGDEQEQPIAGEHVVDELDGALLTDGERDHGVGEDHRVAQRQHRQRARYLLRRVDLDVLRLAHSSPPPVWMSILRAPASRSVRVSLTSSTPASYVAVATSGSTSTMRRTRRSKGP